MVYLEDRKLMHEDDAKTLQTTMKDSIAISYFHFCHALDLKDGEERRGHKQKEGRLL